MKLRSEFNEVIKSAGKIKKAWFTTFNLDITFFETYILPLLLYSESPDKDKLSTADIPKTRKDFEELQIQMLESGIDIRIFCDQRMLDANANKQTTIPVYGVNLSAFVKESPSEPWGTDGIFHPKVIFIEGEKNSIIGSGSANLTISGWGRNREVFLFKNTWSKQNIEQVTSFFSALNKKLEAKPDNLNIKKTVSKSDWGFVHSFQEKPFLEQFFQEETSKPPSELFIFSPYFSSHLANMLDKIREKSGNLSLPINLIPDLTTTGKIRAKHSNKIKEQIEEGSLTILSQPKFINDDEMVHAKLWCSEENIAIGSWNCTGPGTNSSDGDDNNIEAGFFIPNTKNFTKNIELIELENIDRYFMDDKQLEEESLNIASSCLFQVQVTFNWKTRSYRINYNAPRGTNEATLKLPDVTGEISLSGIKGQGKKIVKVNGSCKELLRNRIFIIGDNDGRKLAGYVLEENADYRPVLQHNDLAELIDSLVFSEFGSKNTRADFLENVNEDIKNSADNDEEEGIPSSSSSAPSEITYYRLFKAIGNLHANLKSQDNHDEFIKHASVYPGSVNELAEKYGELAKKNGKSTNSSSLVFQWFFSQEVNRSIDYVNTRLKTDDDKSIVAKRLKVPDLSESKDDPKSREAFLEFVRKECKYGHG